MKNHEFQRDLNHQKTNFNHWGSGFWEVQVSRDGTDMSLLGCAAWLGILDIFVLLVEVISLSLFLLWRKYSLAMGVAVHLPSSSPQSQVIPIRSRHPKTWLAALITTIICNSFWTPVTIYDRFFKSAQSISICLLTKENLFQQNPKWTITYEVLKQNMKQWVSLVCLYQHRAFLTDLILLSIRQESHHQQIVPTESTVLNKGWYNLKGTERTSGSLFPFSGLSSAPPEEGLWFFVALLFVCRSSECCQGLGISAKNSFWQLLYSFSICKLLNKLRIETEKRIRSSAVIWHDILSLFLMTCPLTFFYNVSDF